MNLVGVKTVNKYIIYTITYILILFLLFFMLANFRIFFLMPVAALVIKSQQRNFPRFLLMSVHRTWECTPYTTPLMVSILGLFSLNKNITAIIINVRHCTVILSKHTETIGFLPVNVDSSLKYLMHEAFAISYPCLINLFVLSFPCPISPTSAHNENSAVCRLACRYESPS